MIASALARSPTLCPSVPIYLLSLSSPQSSTSNSIPSNFNPGKVLTLSNPLIENIQVYSGAFLNADVRTTQSSTHKIPFYGLQCFDHSISICLNFPQFCPTIAAR